MRRRRSTSPRPRPCRRPPSSCSATPHRARVSARPPPCRCPGPGGQRALSGASCDRVYGTHDQTLCLQTKQGLATNFQATVYNSTWQETRSWPLPGIPNRARTSADGSLMATTVFVSGHSYSAAGFSTETVIRDKAGQSSGSLEGFALMLDGNPDQGHRQEHLGRHVCSRKARRLLRHGVLAGAHLAGPGQHCRPDAHRGPQRH